MGWTEPPLDVIWRVYPGENMPVSMKSKLDKAGYLSTEKTVQGSLCDLLGYYIKVTCS